MGKVDERRCIDKTETGSRRNQDTDRSRQREW